MDRFSPEFAQRWLADGSNSTNRGPVERRDDDSPSQAQQEELEALAERVSAARSVF